MRDFRWRCLRSGIPTSSEPVPKRRGGEPPLMPAIAMQVRRDLYVSAIAPLVNQGPKRRDGEAAPNAGNGDVRPDLYASAIANWQTSTGTTGRRSRL